MEEEADWSELPMDLLELIVRRYDRFPNYHVRFGAVCESWSAVALENRCYIPPNQFPGLMVPGIHENSPNRRFRRMNHQTGYFEEENNEDSKQLEVPHGCVCRGSAYGWLFLVDDELNTKLLNPFSSAEIQLPSVATLPPPKRGFNCRDKWYVDKAVFSSNPSCSIQQQPLPRPLPPPVILIIYGGSRPRLSYCKPGDEAWTALECISNEKYYFLDAIYFKDRFLALDAGGEILALDIGTSRSSTHSTDDQCEVKVAQYSYIPGIRHVEPMFLVELEGGLVALTAKKMYLSDEISDSDSDDEDYDDDDHDNDYEGKDDDDDDDDHDDYEGKDYREAYRYGDGRTAGFTMLRFETNEQRWVKLKSLGDNALFLGYNTSFSLPMASEHLGCISNSIYFANARGGGPTTQESGYDMGIYNLTDKSINLLYPIGSQLTKPSPIWITRLPC